MPVVLREEELRLLFVCIIAALALVLLFQSIARVAFLLCKRFSRYRWHYIIIPSVPALMVASFHTGLTLYISVMAVGLVLLTGITSWRMGTATFLLHFTLVGFVMLQLVHSLHLIMPSESTTWVSQHYGQVALWPHHGATGPRDILVVYNDVTLTRLPCRDHAVETVPRVTGSAMPVQMQTLISLGDATRIYALEGCTDEIYGKKRRMHKITLLGEKSRLEGVKVRCWPLTPGQKGIDALGTRCLNIASDAVLVNVEMEAYNTSGHLLFTLRIPHANNCADALDQINHISEQQFATSMSLLTCFPSIRGSELLQLLHDHQIVPPFLSSRVPYTLQCLWHMPVVMQNAYGVMSYVVERVLVPVGDVAVLRLFELASALRVGVLYTLGVLAPWGAARVEDVGVMAVGTYCATAGSLHVSLCSAFDRQYASDWRYMMGAWIIDVSCDAMRLALDAVELVPGFWAVHAWALRMEWSLTVGCIGAAKQVLMMAFLKVVWPLLQVLRLAVGSLVATSFRVASPFLDAVDFSLPFRALGYAAMFLWRTEVKWLTMERLLLWSFCSHMYVWLATVLRFVFVTVGVTCSVACHIWGLYTTTTLSAHVFVALIQTLLIVIAMRNELYSITSRENERYPAFISRYAGGAYLVMLAAFTRVYSIGTFRYAMAHVALLLMLIGLSVLQLLSKLYRLTLYVGFPCVSSYVSLEFFSNSPKRVDVVCLSLAKGLLVIVVDYTIGNFVAHLVRDVLFLLAVLVFFGCAFWGWKGGLHLMVLNACQRLCLKASTRHLEITAKAATAGGQSSAGKQLSAVEDDGNDVMDEG